MAVHDQKQDEMKRPACTPDFAARLETMLTDRVQMFIVAILLMLAAIMRLGYIIEFGGRTYMAADAAQFMALAKAIAAGDIFLQGQSLTFSPLYFYFLAGLFSIVGESPQWVMVVQFFLGCVSGYLIYLLAKQQFGTLVGLISLLIYIFYGIIMLFEAQILDAFFSILLPPAFLLMFCRARVTGRWFYWLAGGVLLGLFTLTRQNVLLFLPVVIAWAVLISHQNRPMGKRVAAGGLVLAGWLICILPITIRNWVQTGEPVLITSHGGINFYIGNNPKATGFFTPPPELGATPGVFNIDLPRRLALEETGRDNMTDSEVSSYFYNKGFDFIRRNPDRFMFLLQRKIGAFFSAYELPLNVDYNLFRQIAWSINIPFITFGLVMPLGVIGMTASLRRWRANLILYLFLLVYTVSVVLFFIGDRYRLPVLPVLIIFAAVAVRFILANLKKPAYLLSVIAVFLLLSTFTYRDIVSIMGIKMDPAYKLHNTGHVLENLGRDDEALPCFLEALEYDPNLILTHIELAKLYDRRGEQALARQHAAKAAQLSGEATPPR